MGGGSGGGGGGGDGHVPAHLVILQVSRNHVHGMGPLLTWIIAWLQDVRSVFELHHSGFPSASGAMMARPLPHGTVGTVGGGGGGGGGGEGLGGRGGGGGGLSSSNTSLSSFGVN